jgi:hypothetical protein
MAYKINAQKLDATLTHEGAGAYNYSDSAPLIHLTFTCGSALLTDGFYQTQADEVRRIKAALEGARKVEPRFPWQYGAWMRDPKRGKGNRIQGSLVPALMDSMTQGEDCAEHYVAQCLGHRVDDLMAFVQHYKALKLGAPSAPAKRGIALALTKFDEYQLMKYTGRSQDVRLCDVIYMVRPELEALGEQGALALKVGRLLHAPTRLRGGLVEGLPMSQTRLSLFKQPKSYALDPHFKDQLALARVTWEQVLGQFGSDETKIEDKAEKAEAKKRNRAVWRAMLDIPNLLPDMALARNLRNLRDAGFTMDELVAQARKRRFEGVWPHQIYAGFKAEPSLEPAFDAALGATKAILPKGRHLGIGDASGSMGVKVGGLKGSLTARDVAYCLVGLMSETSGLGASFSDADMKIAQRKPHEGPLGFTKRPELYHGWGGTQVFGAIMDLIQWLLKNKDVAPPDCLWFFSDMQFHPAGGSAAKVPKELQKQAEALGLHKNAPPLELAMKLYRALLGPVDVVLWNLAAYTPVPVSAKTEGVLLVSGFDANTFRHVSAWRDGKALGEGKVEQNQEVILNTIRAY